MAESQRSSRAGIRCAEERERCSGGADRSSKRGHGVSRDARTLLPAAIVLIALCGLFYGYTVDDAYISLRSARHLAEGAGLVWNLGESPPVEGSSNFLRVVLMALAEKAAPDSSVS
jgi:hypothetical protein